MNQNINRKPMHLRIVDRLNQSPIASEEAEDFTNEDETFKELCLEITSMQKEIDHLRSVNNILIGLSRSDIDALLKSFGF